jgi:predicted protein tyrosine phosphatase
MIIVCPLNAVQPLVEEHRVSHVVSLLGPDTPHRSFAGIASERHLKLTFHDILEPLSGFIAPREADAERLVNFIKSWEREMPMLIHCWAGISRSTAAAFSAMCLLRPDANEEGLAWELREASPSATPNRLIVSHVDRLLGREGRMVRAIETIGRGAEACEGVPFTLELK